MKTRGIIIITLSVYIYDIYVYSDSLVGMCGFAILRPVECIIGHV